MLFLNSDGPHPASIGGGVSEPETEVPRHGEPVQLDVHRSVRPLDPEVSPLGPNEDIRPEVDVHPSAGMIAENPLCASTEVAGCPGYIDVNDVHADPELAVRLDRPD